LVHGADGPIHISDGGYDSKKIVNDLLQAAQQVGYPAIDDLQDLDANNGFSHSLKTISPDGRRQDTAHRYLHPLLQDGKHPNLHVLVETQVVRVLFDDNKRASGVEVTPNPAFQSDSATPPDIAGNPDQHPTQPVTIKAKRLVVLTSGALGSPPILERSGIGGREILKRAGVPLVAELPGVGHDYQDHHLALFPYKTSLDPSDTINGILTDKAEIAELVTQGDKRLRWNCVDIMGKLRPTDDEAAALGPEFKAAWWRDFKETRDRPMTLCGILAV
jgi:alcohol oxidase